MCCQHNADSSFVSVDVQSSPECFSAFSVLVLVIRLNDWKPLPAYHSQRQCMRPNVFARIFLRFGDN